MDRIEVLHYNNASVRQKGGIMELIVPFDSQSDSPLYEQIYQYIKEENLGKHYFRIDGDDELTLKIPHAKVNIMTGGGSLTPEKAKAMLERGFYYCELGVHQQGLQAVSKVL